MRKFINITTKYINKNFDVDLIKGEVFCKKTGNKLGSKNKCGYLVIDIYLNGKRRTVYIHRILGTVIEKVSIKGKYCHHINNNKLDNRESNLIVTTQRNNIVARVMDPKKRKCRYQGVIQKQNKDGTVKYIGKIVYTINKVRKTEYSLRQDTEKKAYNWYLTKFAEVNGIEFMPPKLLKDYLRIS
jgi:hypothetical protein